MSIDINLGTEKEKKKEKIATYARKMMASTICKNDIRLVSEDRDLFYFFSYHHQSRDTMLLSNRSKLS